MSRMHASSWEVDELDPAGDASASRRAKPIVRRVPATWEEREGVFHASIDVWSVRVACGPSGAWEWSAFAAAAPRALRCTGFPDRESAQRDAEISLIAAA